MNSSYLGSADPYGLYEKQVLSTDGINSTFTLLYRVSHPTNLLVVSNGVIQEPFVSYNILDGGTKIQISYVPPISERIYIVYLGRSLSVPTIINNFPFRIRLDTVWDSIITDVDLSSYFPSSVSVIREEGTIVFKDGQEQRFTQDFTLNDLPDLKSGNTIKFITAPAINSVVDVYVNAVQRSDISTVNDQAITGSKLINNITIGSNTNKANAIYVKDLFADTTITNYVTSSVELKTHSGFPDSQSFQKTFAITTTTSSATTILSQLLPNNSTTLFDIKLVGRNTTTNENVVVTISGGCVKTGLVLDFLGTSVNTTYTDTSDYSAFVDNNSGDLAIKVVGHPTNSVNWTGTLSYQSITNSI